MLSREELFDKFLTHLEAEQTPPDFLGEEPVEVSSFDPYQMVGEWIALRHEVKQQGKLLHSAQEALQQALEAVTDKEQLQNRIKESQQQASDQYSTELAAQKKQFEREQEGLLRDLLGVIDALDRACAHWQVGLETLPVDSIEAPKSALPETIWQRLSYWFASRRRNQASKQQTSDILPEQSRSVAEVLASNQQGVELIRRTLLEVLRQRMVVPIEVQGQVFDPKRMYAIGRQESKDAPENTVFQEVVRGYMWRDRILREAQVIVAVGTD